MFSNRYKLKMIFSCLIILVCIISTLGKYCDHIRCSNIIDYVCGDTRAVDGSSIIITKYQNICFLRLKQCELRETAIIFEIPHNFCKIKPKRARGPEDEKNPVPEELIFDSRRVQDFSIVGAHQACNHSCPTYCTDTYEPACAQIWTRDMGSYSYRPMINHCHIDLFSCSARLNVTIHPLGRCYKNPSGLLFMMQVAALKSLHLLDDNLQQTHRRAADNRLDWDIYRGISKLQVTPSMNIKSKSDLQQPQTVTLQQPQAESNNSSKHSTQRATELPVLNNTITKN